MSDALRAQLAAVIREDRAQETVAGFSLLKGFPNSETASVPGALAAMRAADREDLLGALARYSTIQWPYNGRAFGSTMAAVSIA
jgi:hypothetical protein